MKALLAAKLLPEIITGTSGGALVAALVATRTDHELHHLLVPALYVHTLLIWCTHILRQTHALRVAALDPRYNLSSRETISDTQVTVPIASRLAVNPFPNGFFGGGEQVNFALAT